MIIEYLLGKCVLGSGHGLYLFGRTEKTMKNFSLVFSDVAETDTVHLLVYYRITFCIVSLHKQLHIYSSYDCDCDRHKRLTFVVNVTDLEKYQVLFCF
jgi:hypothetical protein